MIITIDGPAGTGKSTVAKRLASRLDFLYFDTGAMYRALTWFALKKKINLHDEGAVQALLPEFLYTIKDVGPEKKHHFVGDVDVTSEIRSREVTQNVSLVASYKSPREYLVHIQHNFGRDNRVVFEGRDMGTVVFPNADLKVFLTAKPEIRAERRYLELTQKFPNQTFDRKNILKEIKERDEMDSSRTVSPLVQAKDAHLIDTSKLSIDEVISEIVKIKEQKCPRKASWLYRFIICSARAVGKIFYGLKVYGKENFPKGGGLVIANHTSFYDPPILAAACPEEVHFLARDTLFKRGFLGNFIRKLNAHPVSREGSDTRALRKVLALLKQDYKVILFPEGSRSADGQLLPFQSGVGFLAYKAKSKIIPVHIQGASKIWPKGKSFPRLWGKVICVVGTPIDAMSYQEMGSKEAIEKMTLEAEKSIKNLKSWLENGAKGSLP